MTIVPTDNQDSWCHLQETVTMLKLTSAQIRSSMLDGNNSISELPETLQTIAEQSQKLDELLTEASSPAKQHASELLANVHRGVMACQFHDRVSQHLDHVTESLNQIANIITNPDQFADVARWRALQNEVSESYTLDSERPMFEQIMVGRSVEEALEICRHHFSETDDDQDEVELF